MKSLFILDFPVFSKQQGSTSV